jgi:hypothetical protein
MNIVTWLLKAGMVEPEQKSIAEQRLGNHVSAAKNINRVVSVTSNSNERVRYQVASC